jgi:hypothetical protein
MSFEGIGKLEIEEEFIVVDEPVLFAAVSEDNKRYLVMAYDSAMCEFILVRISNKDLIDMLQNKITMEQTFRKQNEIIETHYEDGHIKCYKYNSSKFSGDKLPRKGEYYELEYQYINDYIAKLESLNTEYISGIFSTEILEEYITSSPCEMSLVRNDESNIVYVEDNENEVFKKELATCTATLNMEYNLPVDYSIAA